MPGIRALILVAVALSATPLVAQEADPAVLSLERIYSSPEFRSERFGPARWLGDGSAYTTVEASVAFESAFEIVRYDTGTGDRSILVAASELVPEGGDAPLEIDDYIWSDDGTQLLIFTNSQRVWRTNTRGDYWVLNRDTGRLSKLGGDAPESTLMFAKFSPDGGRVGYVRYDENNMYVENVADGAITRLTEDGSRTVINGTFDWVYEEEFSLQDGWRWSPDGERIAYWQLDAEGVRDFLLLNTTDSLYSFTIPIQYPKAGETNSAARVGVVAADGGSTRWFDVPGDPRNNYIARLEWAAGSDEVVIQHLNRLQNTLQVMLGDADTGSVRTVLTETDEAWVDMRENVLEWRRGGASFLWVSERSGWRHLYEVSRDGSTVRPITKGAFDVIDVLRIDAAGGWIYFMGSADEPAHRYLYRVAIDGSTAPERLTPDEPATHIYDVAPNGEWAIRFHSTFESPWVTDLVRLPDHEIVRTLAGNQALAATIDTIDKFPIEFFRVDADGVGVDGWVIKPPDFDASKKYPVLFYVYGEPANQLVRDLWFGTRTLWHWMLAQQGYVVVSVDPRGAPAPRGRKWRKSIYRRIGTLSSRDIAAAARDVVAWPYVDPERVAIWGWSGGGSQSLNSIFRYPDLFGTAMAVAPVPDVRLYDTIYQERYMGLPQENPEDYALSSPLTHVDGLGGNLLVIHGTGDDNVHYQGTERLVNALVAANKPFTMMAYPNRTHGIFEGVNTTRHLFELLTRYLRDHVEPGGRDRMEISR